MIRMFPQLTAIADVAVKQEEKIMKLYILTGRSIDELIDLFAQGYTLEPPKDNKESLADLARRGFGR